MQMQKELQGDLNEQKKRVDNEYVPGILVGDGSRSESDDNISI